MTSYEVKRLLSMIVDRVCGGMRPGDRLYRAETGEWWEWRGGQPRLSKAPRKRRKSA